MPISIGVHGGAGPRVEGDVGAVFGEGCLEAARLGYAILQAGGSAVDAVEAAAVAMEDAPLFNAGTGGALNADGEVELDAALMSGERLSAGGVAAVRRVRHPVQLARWVMERTSHLLLVGEGAEAFAVEQGLVLIDPTTLITARQRQRWEKARAAQVAPTTGGTIGVVACDQHGHVAAATSTGGTVLKRRGRVGDSPLIGAGTYADDLGGAVSCTGQGEAIIKVVLAKYASDLLATGREPMAVASDALKELDRVGGDGGLILVDREGRLGWAFNSQRMSRAWIDAQGQEGWGFQQ